MGQFFDLCRRIRDADLSDRETVIDLEVEVMLLAYEHKRVGKEMYRAPSGGGRVVTRYESGRHGTTIAQRYLRNIEAAFNLLANLPGFSFQLAGTIAANPWEPAPAAAVIVAEDDERVANAEYLPNPAAALTYAILWAMGELAGETVEDESAVAAGDAPNSPSEHKQ